MAQESWNCETAEGSGCQPQDGLVLCSNNCGFLGCAATMNLCSKCYRELNAKKKQGISSEMSKISPASNPSPVSLPSVGPEKSFPTSPFPLSLPSSAEQIQQQMALSSSAAASDKIPSAVMESPRVSNPRVSVIESSVADLAPIASLLSSGPAHIKSAQPLAQRHSSNRCLTCRKRMGLLAFKCRCGNVFCASHRYSDKHGCPFDYKSAGREAIAKANPIVIAKKVEKI